MPIYVCLHKYVLIQKKLLKEFFFEKRGGVLYKTFKYLLIFLTVWGLSCGPQAWLPHSMWGLASPTRDRTHVP